MSKQVKAVRAARPHAGADPDGRRIPPREAAMPRGRRALVVGVALGLVLVACGGVPGASTVASGQAAPTTYGEYSAGFCTALLAMTRAIGNPDTGADSDLSFAMEQAIDRGDLTAAREAAGMIGAELRAARQEASRIAQWSEGAPAAGELDRFLAAFEVYVAAMMAAAPQGLPAAQTAAQQAFEGAGALTAWMGMWEGVSALANSPERPMLDCEIPPDPREAQP
jgi:hypothetical protein